MIHFLRLRKELAGSYGFSDKPDPASLVLHFPMLRGVVKFDVAEPGDFKPANFM
jgi:hypothetical protein